MDLTNVSTGSRERLLACDGKMVLHKATAWTHRSCQHDLAASPKHRN